MYTIYFIVLYDKDFRFDIYTNQSAYRQTQNTRKKIKQTTKQERKEEKKKKLGQNIRLKNQA